MIVSIVVPSAATKVAAKVAEAVKAAGTKRSAISRCQRDLTDERGRDRQTLMPAGVHFVDGCIIGSAARMGKGTIVYVSGPDAAACRHLEAFDIPIKILGRQHQSGFGVQSRLRRADQRVAGIVLRIVDGRAPFRIARLRFAPSMRRAFPACWTKCRRASSACAFMPGRRAEEMDELKRTFNHSRPGILHGAGGAARCSQAIAALDTGEASASGARQGDLAETLELFYRKGLAAAGIARVRILKSSP